MIPGAPVVRFSAWRERVAAARVLVVGDVMLDRYWFGDVERISPEAPVPVVKIARTEERPGGAANVARNAAALGALTTLLSVTGDDEAGTALAKLLETERVSATFLRDASLKTTVKLRVIGRQQQLLRIDFETAPSKELLAANLDDYERLLASADVVVMSDDGARFEEPFSGVDGRWRDETDLAQKVHALRKDLGIDALLVTRSEEGMSLFSEAGALTIPAQAREVYDVSGAGDTVIAALGALIAAGAPLPDAMRIANEAAGVVVGKLGTAVAHPSELS